jgi:hypothetical protein
MKLHIYKTDNGDRRAILGMELDGATANNRMVYVRRLEAAIYHRALNEIPTGCV